MGATARPALGLPDRVEHDLAGGALLLLLLGHVRRHGPIHGYALIKAMEETTGRTHWKEGTIYPVLGRLEQEGLLRADWQVGGRGPPRKMYVLTRAGDHALDRARLVWHQTRDALDELLEEP